MSKKALFLLVKSGLGIIVPLLLILFVFIIAIVGNRQLSGSGAHGKVTNGSYMSGIMTPEEAEALPVTGDTYGERMMSLAGKLTYQSTDGTNCMRTASLAMPPDDPRYGALGGGKVVYTVDDGATPNNLERIARDNGWYVQISDVSELQEGDIMIYDGHAVVYSNGMTYQNGASMNTVYEAEPGYNGSRPDFVCRRP